MAYDSTGLYCLANTGHASMWVMRTEDAVGTADGAGYITDADTADSGKGAAGKGMKIGDMVFVQVVSAGTVAVPTAFSDTGWYYVSAISASTGAGTITACGAT